MGKLFLVGLGLQPGHINLEAMNAIKSSDKVFAELYTSKVPSGFMKELEEVVGVKPTVVGRRDLEDENGGILMRALDAGESVVLLSIGDPLMATTHVSLAAMAMRRGHSVKIIDSVSIVCAAFSQSGLSPYKMGPVATVTYERLGYRSKRHADVLVDNLRRGLHTLLLLDIDDGGNFMDAKYAARLVASDVEERGIDAGELLVLYLARVGWSDQAIMASTLKSPPPNLGATPHSLLIPGSLNSAEEEFLEAAFGARGDILKKHKDLIKGLASN